MRWRWTGMIAAFRQRESSPVFINELFTLVVIVPLLYAFWSGSMRAREAALLHARRACQEQQLLLLDETVSLERLRLARAPRGGIAFRRRYGFEFTDDNEQRHRGVVELLGRRAVAVELQRPDGTLHELH